MPIGERAMHVVERARGLDGPAGAIADAFDKVVKPGALKDLLSGTWLGHPLHAALTDFTIGAWVGAAVVDVVGGRRGATSAQRLVGLGVLSAAPTAVTGLSDFADTGGPGRRLALVHAVSNTVAGSLYAASYVARRRGRRGKGMALGMAGLGASMLGAFLGGHLAYRKGIGVDRTLGERRPKDWVRVARADALDDGKPVVASANGADVMLVLHGGEVYALSPTCTHRGGPLPEGRVDHGTVTCPWHESQFRLADGSIARGPAIAPAPAYETRVRDGEIEVRRR